MLTEPAVRFWNLPEKILTELSGSLKTFSIIIWFCQVLLFLAMRLKILRMTAALSLCRHLNLFFLNLKIKLKAAVLLCRAIMKLEVKMWIQSGLVRFWQLRMSLNRRILNLCCLRRGLVLEPCSH